MIHAKCISLMLIVFLLSIGCAVNGRYGTLKRKTGSESEATKKELIDNWSNYDVWLHYDSAYEPPRLMAIIFQAKNDIRNLILEGNYSKVKVKSQKMWTEVLKEHTTSDGDTLVWGYGTEVFEIRGSENQLYGFIIHLTQVMRLQRVELVDGNSILISWDRATSRVTGW